MWTTVATILGCYSVGAYPRQPPPPIGAPITGFCKKCQVSHFNPCDPIDPPSLPIKVITDSIGNDSTSQKH
ncbi:hypothetical protein PGTUg99_017425 [Puccinia graminis f. sp. tritici]|nr:hypothetical protein PGTUg99_017425 [Puccinia graminis f. sp. tritici]